jgi:cobalt-zinc-cadmium efflux system outer membrane protein
MFFEKQTGKRKKMFFLLGLLAALGAPLQLNATERRDLSGVGAAPPAPSSPIDNKTILALEDVLQLALEKSPRLSSSRSEVRVQQARAQQKSLLPNPTLSMGLENLGITDPTASDEGLEATLFLEQVIELGGKRRHRRSVQDSNVRIAEADVAIARLEVISDTTVAFIEALALQRALVLAEEKASLAEELLGAVRLLVEKGALSSAAIFRAEVEELLQRSATRKKARALRESFSRLATMWGAEDFEYSELRGNLAIRGNLPSWTRLESMLKRSPQQKRWDAEVERSRLAVELEDARRIPDIRLGMGPKYFNENDEWGLQLGFSVALPVFDRNQGARRESRARLARTRDERLEEALAFRRRLSRAREAMLLSYDEAQALQEEIIPSARQAYKAVKHAHLEGAFDMTAVLDAQRSLFDLQSRLLEAERAYRVALARAELLVGESILAGPGG